MSLQRIYTCRKNPLYGILLISFPFEHSIGVPRSVLRIYGKKIVLHYSNQLPSMMEACTESWAEAERLQEVCCSCLFCSIRVVSN